MMLRSRSVTTMTAHAIMASSCVLVILLFVSGPLGVQGRIDNSVQGNSAQQYEHNLYDYMLRHRYRTLKPSTKTAACDLAKILVQHNVPRHEIPHWVCLAHHESNFNMTRMKRRLRSRCTSLHGIFGVKSSPPLKSPRSL